MNMTEPKLLLVNRQRIEMSRISHSHVDKVDQTNSLEDEPSIAVSELAFNMSNDEVPNSSERDLRSTERDMRSQEKGYGFGVYKRLQNSSICNTVQ